MHIVLSLKLEKERVLLLLIFLLILQNHLGLWTSMGINKFVSNLSFLVFLFIGSTHGAVKDEKKKMHTAYAKTVQLESGDIFDCIDINKQFSLENPLLKGHTVQLKPTRVPRMTHVKKVSSDATSHVQISKIGCPLGTVPIRRRNGSEANKHDGYPRFRSHSTTIYQDSNVARDGYLVMRGTTKGTYYGAKVSLSVHALGGVGPTQVSGAMLWLSSYDKPPFVDQVAVGWSVNHGYYHDYRPRLTILYSTVQGGGCDDMMCPGFVHVNPDIAIGAPFSNVSSYMGTQYHMTAEIFNDPVTHAWWLWYGEHPQGVGYWPKELFTAMAKSADGFTTGGMATSRAGDAAPPIGSGHYPGEGFGRAAFVKDIQLVDTSDGSPVPVSAIPWLRLSYKTEHCYVVGYLDDRGEFGPHFYYGGPGGCKCEYRCG